MTLSFAFCQGMGSDSHSHIAHCYLFDFFEATISEAFGRPLKIAVSERLRYYKAFGSDGGVKTLGRRIGHFDVYFDTYRIILYRLLGNVGGFKIKM